jgi:hypothetical protein
MAAKEFRAGEGLATAVAVFAAGVAETPGTGVAALTAGVSGTWEFTAAKSRANDLRELRGAWGAEHRQSVYLSAAPPN